MACAFFIGPCIIYWPVHYIYPVHFLLVCAFIVGPCIIYWFVRSSYYSAWGPLSNLCLPHGPGQAQRASAGQWAYQTQQAPGGHPEWAQQRSFLWVLLIFRWLIDAFWWQKYISSYGMSSQISQIISERRRQIIIIWQSLPTLSKVLLLIQWIIMLPFLFALTFSILLKLLFVIPVLFLFFRWMSIVASFGFETGDMKVPTFYSASKGKDDEVYIFLCPSCWIPRNLPLKEY